ncbi:MAG: hypothetical protein WBP34_14400, partial [Thermoanaerobaculia bacterium]
MSRKRVVVAGLCVFASVMQGWELAESAQVGSARLDVVDRAIEYHGGDRYLDNRTSLEVCSKSGCYEVSAAVQAGRYEYRVRGPYRGGV